MYISGKLRKVKIEFPFPIFMTLNTRAILKKFIFTFDKLRCLCVCLFISPLSSLRLCPRPKQEEMMQTIMQYSMWHSFSTFLILACSQYINFYLPKPFSFLCIVAELAGGGLAINEATPSINISATIHTRQEVEWCLVD